MFSTVTFGFSAIRCDRRAGEVVGARGKHYSDFGYRVSHPEFDTEDSFFVRLGLSQNLQRLVAIVSMHCVCTSFLERFGFHLDKRTPSQIVLE